MFLQASIVVLLALLSCIVSGEQNKIKHVRYDSEQYVEAGNQDYALTAKSILPSPAETVSVRGDQILVFGSDCSVQVTNINSLSNEVQTRLLETRERLAKMVAQPDSYLSDKTHLFNLGIISTDSDGIQSKSSRDRQLGLNFVDGNLVSTLDEDYKVVQGPNLPQDVSRAIVASDIATFVFADGRPPQMKPKQCLDSSEQKLFAASYSAPSSSSRKEQQENSIGQSVDSDKSKSEPTSLSESQSGQQNVDERQKREELKQLERRRRQQFKQQQRELKQQQKDELRQLKQQQKQEEREMRRQLKDAQRFGQQQPQELRGDFPIDYNNNQQPQQQFGLPPQQGGAFLRNYNNQANSWIPEQAEQFGRNLQPDLRGIFNNFRF